MIIKEYERILQSKEFKETQNLLMELKKKSEAVKSRRGVVFKLYQELFNNILSRTKATGVFIKEDTKYRDKKHELTIGKFGIGIKRSWSERSYGIGQWELFESVLPILNREKVDKMSNCIRSKVKKDLFLKFFYFLLDNKNILCNNTKFEDKIEITKNLKGLTEIYTYDDYDEKPQRVSGSKQLKFTLDENGYEIEIILGNVKIADFNIDNIKNMKNIIIYEQIKDIMNKNNVLRKMLRKVEKEKKKEIDFLEKLNTNFGTYIMANKL